MPDRLKDSSSPFLRRLAKSPINWNGWESELMLSALEHSKPIFLTIDSGSDPRCQKMIYGSFYELEIAELLNREFLCIAVDRDERPDIAESYLYYIKGIRAQKGWPLSLWLTPELNPFYGGSYFPIEDRAGSCGFRTVLNTISVGWIEDKDAVILEANKVRENLMKHQAPIPLGESIPNLATPGGIAYEACFNYLFENYDSQDGGFGGAPKFARWPVLNFLLRCSVLQGLASDDGIQAIDMVSSSVQKMLRGGIFDHVAGGVFQFSHDDAWRFPAFKKSPNDQASLVFTLLECAIFTGNRRFQSVAFFSLEEALRDLSQLRIESSSSAKVGIEFDVIQAAESCGQYYCWTMDEVGELLGDEASLVCDYLGITENINLTENHANKGLMANECILYQAVSLSEFAERRGLSEDDLSANLTSGLERLKKARDRRTNGFRETRFFTNANCPLIGALARAARASAVDGRQSTTFLDAGIGVAEFVERSLWNRQTRSLSHVYARGKGSGVGFAEDYAALVSGLIELYDATFAPRWLKFAVEVQRAMDADFWDEIGGGYFRSAASDASVYLRLKDCFDSNDASANSQAALNLFRLGAILNDFSFRERGFQVLQAFRELWEKTPWNHAHLLLSLEWALTPPKRVLLWGRVSDEGEDALADELGDRRRGPFVSIRADLLVNDDSPEIAGVVPSGIPQGKTGEFHVYRDETLLGIAQTAAELRDLLTFGSE